MACGEGLNLTALVTEIIILYDPKYIVYSEKERASQKKRNITIITFIGIYEIKIAQKKLPKI